MRKIKSCAVKAKNYKAFLNENLTNAAASSENTDIKADKMVNPLDEWTESLLTRLFAQDEDDWEYNRYENLYLSRCDYCSEIMNKGNDVEKFLKIAPLELKDEVIRQFYGYESPHDYPGGIPTAFFEAILKKKCVSGEIVQKLQQHINNGCFVK